MSQNKGKKGVDLQEETETEDLDVGTERDEENPRLGDIEPDHVERRAEYYHQNNGAGKETSGED